MLFNISYKDHVKDKEVCRKIQTTIEEYDEYDELLTLVKKGETKVVWPHPKAFWFSKDTPTGHSERKKKRWAEEEVGRQY